MEFQEAMAVLSALERHGVRYVLIGSMAMAAQGLIRATRDMDVFVAPDPDNIARLKKALQQLFDDPEIEAIRADELAGDFPAVQYVPPHGDYWIDILTRLGDAFRFADINSEDFVVDGVRVHVATPLMLYRMKRDTVRAQDRLDAQLLKERFHLEDQ
jgi:hypothetical protein